MCVRAVSGVLQQERLSDPKSMRQEGVCSLLEEVTRLLEHLCHSLRHSLGTVAHPVYETVS